MTDQARAGEDHLGDPGAHQAIDVLAPYRPAVGAYPVSSRTGEPQRPVMLGIACGLLVAGAVVSSVGLVTVLWDAATVTGYHTAARILEWTKPNPVSFLTIVMVLTIGAIGALVATAATAIAYNAWNGRRWARLGGIVALAISGHDCHGPDRHRRRSALGAGGRSLPRRLGHDPYRPRRASRLGRERQVRDPAALPA
jgi:hypothetical protein